MLAPVEDDGSVDHDVGDTFRILVRIGKGSPVDDSLSVEQDQVGLGALANHAAIRQAKALGR